MTEDRNALKHRVEDLEDRGVEKDRELKARADAISAQAAEIAKLERAWNGEKKKVAKLTDRMGEERTAMAMLQSEVSAALGWPRVFHRCVLGGCLLWSGHRLVWVRVLPDCVLAGGLLCVCVRVCLCPNVRV